MLMFGCKGLRELGSEENENKKMWQQYTVKQFVQIQEMTSSPDTRADDSTGDCTLAENENKKMLQTSSPFTRSFGYYVNTIND